MAANTELRKRTHTQVQNLAKAAQNLADAWGDMEFNKIRAAHREMVVTLANVKTVVSDDIWRDTTTNLDR